MNKRTSVAFDSLIFGGLGIQWFLLEKPAYGLLSIFFCWTTIPSWIAIYHVVLMLTMSDENFTKKYGVK